MERLKAFWQMTKNTWLTPTGMFVLYLFHVFRGKVPRRNKGHRGQPHRSLLYLTYTYCRLLWHLFPLLLTYDEMTDSARAHKTQKTRKSRLAGLVSEVIPLYSLICLWLSVSFEKMVHFQLVSISKLDFFLLTYIKSHVHHFLLCFNFGLYGYVKNDSSLLR